MKVEKCPRCGTRGTAVKVNACGYRWLTSGLCPCAKAHKGWTERTSILRYNRWARREAKRIAKEGKGK